MGTRVLVVEDSAVIRERIRALLEPIPSVIIVGHAETASDAISAIVDLSPDIITLDIGLRSGNGFDVLRWLSADNGHQPEVIVITLLERDSVQERLSSWKVRAVLDKSTDFGRLTEEIVKLGSAIPKED